MPALSRFLRYFMAVGHHGSIRRAADDLGISPSAVDRQLLNAEAELGAPLFERLPSGLRLTAAGEIMMAAGRRWQKELGDVRDQIADLQGLRRGHVQIAIIDALARGAVPAMVSAIQARHPGIGIGISVLGNDAVRAAVASGEADMGILLDPHSYRDLVVRAFVEVVLGVATPPGHPLGGKRDVRFSACAGFPLIVPAHPLVISEQLAALEGATGLSPARVATCDHSQMIASLVMQGAGLGILTSIDVAPEVEEERLGFARLSDPILRPLTLALCTASVRTPSHAAAMALGEIEAGFAQLGYDRDAA